MAIACLWTTPALASSTPDLNLLSQYITGLGTGGAEISAYDPGTRRLFVINGVNNTLSIVNLANPAAPALVGNVSLAAYGAFGNSVAVHNGLVAVAVQAAIPQNPGRVGFLDTNGAHLGDVAVGSLPDMVTFTPGGLKVLVANEGEPNGAYTVDPEGTVSIIDLAGGVGLATVSTVSFVDFNVGGPRHAELPAAVRIYGPGATVAKDLEPEFITTSADGLTAWVGLQENNAIAVIDVATATVIRIDALGFKDWNVPGITLDPSDQNGGINRNNWPVVGMYQPDALASFVVGGTPYILSANEGDARDYSGFAEEIRVSSGSYPLDPAIFPNAATLKLPTNMGRLTVTRSGGNLDADADYERIQTLGGRSFSIWNGTTGALVYDSGDDFEQITATAVPAIFNSNGDAGTFDTRSDNKGPEPESVTTGSFFGRTFAFVGLERTGGVMVYEITDPLAPSFVLYEPNAAGALAPEGLVFIPGAQGPDGRALLVSSNEVSGTVSIYEVVPPDEPVSVVLARFEAGATPEGIDLAWETAAESNHSHFNLYRRPDRMDNWTLVNAAPIRAEAVHPGRYAFRDREAPDSGDLTYRLDAVDRQGVVQNVGEIRVLADRRPASFSLAPSGPNPFSGRIAFTLDLPVAGSVRMRLFDASGRLVRSFSDNTLMSAGRHEVEWDGRSADGGSAPAGVYYLRAESGDASSVVRVLKID